MVRLPKLALAVYFAYRAFKFARDNIDASFRVARQRAQRSKIYVEPDADAIFTALFCDAADSLAYRVPLFQGANTNGLC